MKQQQSYINNSLSPRGGSECGDPEQRGLEGGEGQRQLGFWQRRVAVVVEVGCSLELIFI